jgi:ABC-2 type transport system ATP-binding protein
MIQVDARELSLAYGRRAAVDRLSLRVEAGAALGLVGRPGAGKTSVIRMLAGLLRPTGGDAAVAGASVRREAARVRRLAGYMPADSGAVPDTTVAGHMEFHAACHGIPREERAPLIRDLLELVDLGHRRNERLERLTRATRQRLSLARALIHDPPVLLLDEPAAGLDPRARVELRELLRELRGMGKTIVLTSRLIAQVEDLCTDVALLDGGRAIVSGEIQAIRARLQPHRILSIKFFGETATALHSARTGDGVIDARLAPPAAEAIDGPPEDEGIPDGPPPVVNALKEMRVAFDGGYSQASDLLRHLMRSGVQVVSFSEQSDALERWLAGQAEARHARD